MYILAIAASATYMIPIQSGERICSKSFYKLSYSLVYNLDTIIVMFKPWLITLCHIYVID